MKKAFMSPSEPRLALWRRYVRFCLVGGSGVAVDMGIIWLLADPRMLGGNLSLSKVIAAEVAICNNFLWNDVWTFRDLGENSPNDSRVELLNRVAPPHPALSPAGGEGARSAGEGPGHGQERSRWRALLIRFGKFNLICLAGIGWSVLLLQAQVAGLGLNVYLANFISIVAVSVWNFGMNLKFGWTSAPAAKPQPSASTTNGPE